MPQRLPVQPAKPRPPAARRRRWHARHWLAAAAAGAGLLALLWFVSAQTNSPPATAERAPSPLQPDGLGRRPTPPVDRHTARDVASSPGKQLVDDPDATLLWASPTAGPPISLAWIPGGAQCLVHFRPAQVVAHPEGEKVVAALGPWGRSAVGELRAITAAELTELDAVLMAIIVGDGNRLDAVFRVELTAPWDIDALARRFPSGRDATLGGQVYRVVGERAYFLPSAASPSPPGDEIHTLFICPAQMIAEVIDSEGQPPQLIRDLEVLVERSDADRSVSIILAPRFLHASGSQLLSDAATPLRDSLRWLLRADSTAVALSGHWDNDFFLELRAAPALTVPAHRLAAILRERIRNVPAALEEAIAAHSWQPYGAEVLRRLPAMARTMASYARTGDEDKQAVANCYLPAIAGHNLLMAAELMLTQSAGAPESPGDPSSPGATVVERLAKTTSLTFAKDTLQRAVELLADDLGVEISISGRDLQAEGITKNQSSGIDLRDRPGAEILVEVLRQANPDRTATGPADPRQRLVYVIEQPPGDAPGRIIVTTRAAAEKRGQALPAVFLGKGS